MAMYELDGNHLLPARLGRSADAETRARSLAAVQRQVVEILHRPLFPLEWGKITGGESLTALDATGQVVLVEVLESLSAAEVMAAMARLTATAALGRRELAGRYTGGLVSFREDWNEFREAMPAQVEAGPRLTLITASLAPEVRSSLSVLVGSGVELYEVDVRVVDEARVVVVVEQIVDGSLGAEGPLLVARAPRPSLTGPGTRSGEPAPEPKIEPVTGPIEIVMPRRSQDAGRADDASASASGRGARRTAGGRAGGAGRGAAAGAAVGQAGSGRASQAAPGRSGSATSSEHAAQATRGSTGGPSSRQTRPEAPGSSPAEGSRRGSAAGRRAHAAVSARRDTVVRRGVHASEAGEATDTAAEAEGAVPPGPGAGESRHDSATAPSAASAASAAGVARGGARHTAAPTASSAPAAASRQARSTGSASASSASSAAGEDPWSGRQPGGAARDSAPRSATGESPRGAARSAGSTRAARRGGAEGGPGAASAQSAASAGSAWAATGGQQEASASPLPRIAAREAADLAAIASGFERSQRIIWQGLRRGIYHEAVLSSAGIITLADGRTFTDPTSAANAAQSVADADGWRVWRLGLRGPQLGELRDRLPRSGA